ncbi:MAG TPA: 50S ribosomal protein L25/general stress protein Ctc [Thermodesulfobacteriota bacterium]|nr:50S ribosomal protein L25/general stress protein Ctc [Thermodesulfobacteriota bacterium]
MAQSTLVVKKREGVGKSAARKVRKEGAVPAIVYGRETEPIPIVVNLTEFKKALSTEAGENTLLELHIKDDGEEITKLALLRDIQFDYLTSRPLHFDFQEVLMKEKLTVKVPVRIMGKAEGVKSGGILEEILREIEIECLPADIPNYIEVDVSNLGIGDSIHIGDLTISENVTVLHEPDETIVTILSPTVEEVVAPAPTEEAAAQAGAEAEAKEGEEE